MYTKKQLEDMKKSDILEAAANELGVEMDETRVKDELIKDFLSIQDSMAKSPAGPVSAPTKEAGKVKIIIAADPGRQTGQDDVAVQVNGVAYQIHRGVPVEVPVPVFEALQNAVETHYYPLEGGGFGERDVPRFNMQVVRD